MTNGSTGYREIAPHPALASHILRFWTSTIPDARDPATALVIPDGCADIIWVDHLPPIVVGPITAATMAWPSPGSVVTGVRFRPGMAAVALRERCEALLDREVPLAAIWGDVAVRETQCVIDAVPPSKRMAAIATALLARRIQAADGDPAVLAAVDWLRRNPTGRLSWLVDELGLSERQLRRRVVEAVGYGPKTFQRVMRVQRGLAAMSTAPTNALDLAILAAETGFADQAHMTREFRRITSMTPHVALASRAAGSRATGWLD